LPETIEASAGFVRDVEPSIAEKRNARRPLHSPPSAPRIDQMLEIFSTQHMVMEVVDPETLNAIECLVSDLVQSRMVGGSRVGCHQYFLTAGRGVCGAKLACFLPDLHHFVLRQQPGELHILERAGGYHNAANRRCCAGVRHIEDDQNARAISGSAIHRNAGAWRELRYPGAGQRYRERSASNGQTICFEQDSSKPSELQIFSCVVDAKE
jgi:hypothetical protein